MASREDTYERAEANFSRSLSARSVGSGGRNARYDDTDPDYVNDDDDYLVNELIGESNNAMHRKSATIDTLRASSDDEPELIAVKRVPKKSNDYSEFDMEGGNNNENYNENEDEGGEVEEGEGDQEPDNDPYLNPLCKTAIAVGKTNIGYSTAKMFGLCDNSGNVKLGESGIVQPISAATKQRLDKMSKPREVDVEYIMSGVDDEENEARARAKREANKAMSNPKCGYDFVSRLNDRGDFLDRASSKGGKGADKAKLDIEEQDYNARLDKLACPTCKRTQTFDEYHEKRRFCSQCKEKFTKINLCNAGSFDKRMKEAQKQKEAKLAALDANLYKSGDKTKKFIVGVGLVSIAEDGKQHVIGSNATTSRKGSVQSAAGSKSSGGANNKQGPKAVNVLSELAQINQSAHVQAEQLLNGKHGKKASTASEEELTAQKFKKLAMYNTTS